MHLMNIFDSLLHVRHCSRNYGGSKEQTTKVPALRGAYILTRQTISHGNQIYIRSETNTRGMEKNNTRNGKRSVRRQAGRWRQERRPWGNGVWARIWRRGSESCGTWRKGILGSGKCKCKGLGWKVPGKFKKSQAGNGWRGMGWGRILGDRSESGAAGRPHRAWEGGSFLQAFTKCLLDAKHHAQHWGALAF